MKDPADSCSDLYELSAWKCSSLDDEEIRKGLKAALLASSGIRNSWFVILSSEDLDDAGVTIDESSPGKTGLKGGESLHVNLKNLTYKKIGKLLVMYRKSIGTSAGKILSEIRKEKVREIVLEACRNDEINEDAINLALLKDIKRYKAKEEAQKAENI